MANVDYTIKIDKDKEKREGIGWSRSAPIERFDGASNLGWIFDEVHRSKFHDLFLRGKTPLDNFNNLG